MKIFDIRCDFCNTTWEGMANEAGEPVECKHCGKEAASIISSCNFTLPGYDPAYPTAADRWARRHEIAARRRG